MDHDWENSLRKFSTSKSYAEMGIATIEASLEAFSKRFWTIPFCEGIVHGDGTVGVFETPAAQYSV